MDLRHRKLIWSAITTARDDQRMTFSSTSCQSICHCLEPRVGRTLENLERSGLSKPGFREYQNENDAETMTRFHCPTTLKGSQRFLRYPFIIIIAFFMLLECILYVLLRILVTIWEFLRERCRSSRIRRTRKLLDCAPDRRTWARLAQELDRLENREGWKSVPHSKYYDHRQLMNSMSALRSYSTLPCEGTERNAATAFLAVLQAIFSKPNYAGIENGELYSKTYHGTKALVTNFVETVVGATETVKALPLPLQTKLRFFKNARVAFGRTALVLSGGAGFGYYHIGVMKALLEAGCLPHIISGTSAGSLMAALVSVRTDEELVDFFRPESARFFTACDAKWTDRCHRFRREGVMFSVEAWIQKMLLCCGDYTFQEAFERTGRVLNIPITPNSKYGAPMLLNHLVSPHVVVYSAVLASSAIPLIIGPIQLLEKNPQTHEIRVCHSYGSSWVDGTIKSDVPVDALSHRFNCNYFIVSQVNPHVIPFVFDSRGSAGRPSPRTSGSRMRGGFLSSYLELFLKLEMRKWLKLLSAFDLLPNVFGQDWRFLFTQKLHGTVTILPKPRLKDYFHIISDPTVASFADFISLSERNTWPKLARIRHHYQLEQTLLHCERELLQQTETKEEEEEEKEEEKRV